MRTRVLGWYRKHRRDLPWRRTSDPYAIWVSEIMLQQTRVDTVRHYFSRFIERWPDASALAAATPEEVRAAWSGLGYYRRAQLMHRAAQVLVDEHGGHLPSEPVALAALPGFGRYTVGAVSSIAFGHGIPAADGNVMRVLARIFEVEGDVSKGAPNKVVWSHAEALSKGKAPGDLNQGLIELGATVCTPRRPGCSQCPVARDCGAFRNQRTAEIPPPRARPAKKRLELTAILCTKGRAVILEQRPKGGIFAELWTPPLLEGHLDADAAVDEAARRWGWAIDSAKALATISHTLTHREIHVQIHGVRADAAPKPLRAVGIADLSAFGVPSMTSKILREALPADILRGTHLPGRRTVRSGTSA